MSMLTLKSSKGYNLCHFLVSNNMSVIYVVMFSLGFQDLYCVRSDLGNLLKALGRLDEAKVCSSNPMLCIKKISMLIAISLKRFRSTSSRKSRKAKHSSPSLSLCKVDSTLDACGTTANCGWWDNTHTRQFFVTVNNTHVNLVFCINLLTTVLIWEISWKLMK